MPVRAPRAAKKRVNYRQDSDFSSDDLADTSPVRKRQKPDFPMRGPSIDRMAAHTGAQLKSKEKDAVDALLVLNQGQGNGATSNNMNSADPQQDINSTVDSTDDSTSNDSNYSNNSKSEDSVQAASDSTSPGSTSLDSESSDKENSFDSENEVPFAAVKESLQPEPEQPKKGKAYFKTMHHGLQKPKKRSRKFPCEKCEFTGTSQGELNQHFLENHGQLVCSQCSKNCATISAYCKHLYEHSALAAKYPCTDCNRSFPFASQLKNHRKLHLSVPEHGCIHCDKRFKHSGELTKHLAVHGKKVWSCDQCDYSNKDPRNLHAHKHTHGNKTRYHCNKCQKGFNHYMQLKCHKTNPDNCK